MVRLGHVHLPVPELARSVAFYRDRLGLEVGFTSDSMAEFPAAGLVLDQESGFTRSPAPGTVGLAVDDVDSVFALLAAVQPCFPAPAFRTFCALTAGFLAQTGRRTVCGMLTGAGLSRAWPHHRAHRLFSHARWSAEDLGLAPARLVVALLVPAGAPVLIAVDDTLFKRTGKKVHAIGWFHDGSAKGPHQVGLANNWVIAAIVVTLPSLTPPVALPVLARLVYKDLKPAPASRL